MNLVEIIQQDYQNFPQNQTYSIYAENVHFRDPIYNFYGKKKYQSMITFLSKWFKNLRLELHEIKQEDNQIKTRWTMSWVSPLPWQPSVAVTGTSILEVNDNLIVGHYDYWDCSVWDLIAQHFHR
jgi:hypothetical protein